MSAREVFFLIGRNETVLYRDEGSGPTFIPDARTRWEAIWSRRDELVEIAHSHPVGPLAFSAEDDTTMDAITSALGRTVVFSVVTPGSMLRRIVSPDATAAASDQVVDEEPPWAAELRRQSGV
ncbi:MAG: hypothetical protein HOW73_02465 [Polyangiaceae bacterium]|nr:hypothetical protein [Polyangiaceae bacterium]